MLREDDYLATLATASPDFVPDLLPSFRGPNAFVREKIDGAILDITTDFLLPL